MQGLGLSRALELYVSSEIGYACLQDPGFLRVSNSSEVSSVIVE